MANRKKNKPEKENSIPVETPENPETVTEKVTGEVIDRVFSEEELKKYDEICLAISEQYETKENAELSIALMLDTVKRRKLYEVGNYKSLFEFANNEFGILQTRCSTYSNICEKFGEYDTETNLCVGLKPEYKDFCMSQLIEMLPMSEALRKEVTPDMSVRSIKIKKRIYNNRLQVAEKNNNPSTEESFDIPEPESKSHELEVMRSKDILSFSEDEVEQLEQKKAEFEEKYPDIPYVFSISIVYDSLK